MGMILIATLIIGLAGGYVAALAQGKIAQIAGRDGAEIRRLRTALNIAKSALGEIRAGAAGKPETSAEIALYDINKEETK